MRIATFNVQHMRLRPRPDGGAALEGAWDPDMPGAAGDPRLDARDRRLTAEVLRAVDADVVALQEVFDAATLDHFHDHVLRPTGARPYPWRVCLPGNDGQGLNVAVMARRPLSAVVSHAAETGADLGLGELPDWLRDRPLFRRDCLEVTLDPLVLFVCHFKAPYPDTDRAALIRHAEARAVRALVERRFADPAGGLWLVLGDLNEPQRPEAAGPSALAPLRAGFAVDLFDRLPPEEAWTFARRPDGQRSRPDAMLASPALAAACPGAVPHMFRAGTDPAAARGAGPRFDDTGDPRPHASDHAAVWAEFAGL